MTLWCKRKIITSHCGIKLLGLSQNFTPSGEMYVTAAHNIVTQKVKKSEHYIVNKMRENAAVKRYAALR